MKYLQKLKEELRPIYCLRAVSELLSWDQETYMPIGAASARAEQAAERPGIRSAAANAADAGVAPARKKLSYKEQRELAALPERIDALEKEIAAIEADLAAARIYTSDRLAPAQTELEALVERWAELAERDS